MRGAGCGKRGEWCGVEGLGCRVDGLGLRVEGLGSRVQALRFKVQGSYLGRVQGLGCGGCVGGVRWRGDESVDERCPEDRVDKCLNTEHIFRTFGRKMAFKDF